MRTTKSTDRSLSGAVRESLKRLPSEEFWQQAQAMAHPKARALGITEADVAHLVDENRREKRAKTRKQKHK